MLGGPKRATANLLPSPAVYRANAAASFIGQDASTAKARIGANGISEAVAFSIEETEVAA